MSVLLETHAVGKAYGPLRALENVTMSVKDGERVSIVGPNGAGKTTLVNVITGLLAPTEGEVLFMGDSPKWPSKQSGQQPRDTARR